MTGRLPRLTPEKRRLLSQLVKQRQHLGGECRSGIPTADRSKPLPLSFGQERLWFLDQMAPGNPFYNDCEAFRLRGPLDAEALERALNRIVDRHEILRTAFPTRDGRPRQQVTAELEVRLSSTDLSHMSPEQQRSGTAEIAGRDLDRPFVLERLPLHRFHLVRHASGDYVLLFTLHHIIFDGWSLGVFVRELGTFYEAEVSGIPPDLPTLSIQYADFAAWQRQRMQGEFLERHLDYWRERLAGPIAALELPTDRPRSPTPTYRGRLCNVDLGADLSAAVRHLGQRARMVIFTLYRPGI